MYTVTYMKTQKNTYFFLNKDGVQTNEFYYTRQEADVAIQNKKG
jgi:hypothetical protein